MNIEWHHQRLGRFTASEIHKLMGERGGITTETAQTYIREKVAEQLSGWWDEVTSKEMEWGKQLEPDAREYYELAFGVKTGRADFIVADWCDDAGCTPDGLIMGQSKGIEIKCPWNPANHVSHMMIKTPADFKKTNKKYYWQVQMCMAVMGFDVWDFISYDPRFTGKHRMYVVEIPLVMEDVDNLKNNILAASKQKNDILTIIKER